MNPSTADAEVDDPTIRRCISFADGWGYGELVMLNLFPLRSTDPKRLSGNMDKESLDVNDTHLLVHTLNRNVLCAWGNNGALYGRGRYVESLLRLNERTLFHLGLTKNGSPRHPLYLRSDESLREWR